MNPFDPTPSTATDPSVSAGAPAAPSPHEQAQADFSLTSGAMAKMDKIRVELTKLAKLGDTVQSDDVVKAAGRLVAHGIDPMKLAGILSDMPTTGGGQALAGWIASSAQGVAQKEAQIGQLHEQARHNLGVSAMQQLNANAAPPALAPSGGPLNG